MDVLVSILIPVYNAEQWLPTTLRSAFDQTWPHIEVIVVDDGSTDESLSIARRHEGPKVKVIAQSNRGGCVARNRALAAAQGDYIQYLDADDLLHPNKIAVQVRRLQEESPHTVAAGKWERFYAEVGEGPLPEVYFRDKPYYGDRPSGLDWAVDAVRNDAMMPSHAWLLPRSVADAAGLWNDDLQINQDGEYFNRVVLASDGIAFCDDARAYYRSGLPGSVSQQHTAEALWSKLASIELIASQLLRHEGTPEVRNACAVAFQHLAESAYPTAVDVATAARRRVVQLGGVTSYEPDGSRWYIYAHNLLGWKAAKQLKYWYYRARYERTV